MKEEVSNSAQPTGVSGSCAADGSTPTRPKPQALVRDGVRDPARDVAAGAGWKVVALTSIGLILALNLGTALYFLAETRADTKLNDETLNRMERKIQQLSAGISFDSQRQQLLLGIRDEIMRANSSISLNDAYQYSELILRASEKFPSIDPLLLVSMGIVESGFKTKAVSRADARGLFQIQPSTGRLLARGLNWEFSKDMLFDPEKNTEMASLYLDILFATYNDTKLVLAEYNGGPMNAAFFRTGSSRLSPETKDYVAKVLDVRHRLENRFKRGIEARADQIHMDPPRAAQAPRRDTYDSTETPTDKAATTSE